MALSSRTRDFMYYAVGNKDVATELADAVDANSLESETEVADPGSGAAIPVTKSACVAFTVAGTETNTLAIPTFVGQTLVLVDGTHTSGTRTVTSAQAVNQAGNNTLVFAQVADVIVLTAVKIGGALRWRVLSNDGVALSTV